MYLAKLPRVNRSKRECYAGRSKYSCFILNLTLHDGLRAESVIVSYIFHPLRVVRSQFLYELKTNESDSSRFCIAMLVHARTERH